MNRVSILSSQWTKNKDLIVKLLAEPSLLGAMPGQYVNCKLTADSDDVLSAYVFSVNHSSACLEIYFRHEVASKISLAVMPEYLYVSNVLGESFLLPKVLSAKKILSTQKIKPVLIADDLGLPSIIYLAEKIKNVCQLQPLVILFSGGDFPFTPKPSQFFISEFPDGLLASCPLLEDKKIPSRLICDKFSPGCYEGDIGEFLNELPDDFFNAVANALTTEVFAMAEKKSLDQIRAFSQQRGLSLQEHHPFSM